MIGIFDSFHLVGTSGWMEKEKERKTVCVCVQEREQRNRYGAVWSF